MVGWWHDPQLRFNSSNQQLTDLTVSREEVQRVWRPDLYWEKSIEVTLPSKTDGRVKGSGESFVVSNL